MHVKSLLIKASSKSINISMGSFFIKRFNGDFGSSEGAICLLERAGRYLYSFFIFTPSQCLISFMRCYFKPFHRDNFQRQRAQRLQTRENPIKGVLQLQKVIERQYKMLTTCFKKYRVIKRKCVPACLCETFRALLLSNRS